MDPRLRGSDGAEVAGMTKGSETPGAPFPGCPPAWIDRAAPHAWPVPQREIAPETLPPPRLQAQREGVGWRRPRLAARQGLPP